MPTKLTLEKATRSNITLKMGLYGIGGAGKTYTALKLMRYLAGPDNKIAVIDSENRSSEKYAGSELNSNFFDFYILSLGNPNKPDDLSEYTPEKYLEALKVVADSGIKHVIIDSLSHVYMWSLEEVNRLAPKYRGNTFAPWKDISPRYNALMRYVTNSNLNIISTMRAKESHVMQETSGGKSAPKAVGMEPIIRAGYRFEFDVVASMAESSLIIEKTRCFELDGRVFSKPGDDLGEILKNWLSEGISEEEVTKRKYIRKIVELQDALDAASIKYETATDLNACTNEQLIEIGKSLKVTLDSVE